MKARRNISIVGFLFVLSLILGLSSCHNNRFKYSKSKIWKHGVYSKYDAAKYEKVFDGLEVDLIYSTDKDDIYIGRIEGDENKNCSFDEWLAMLKKPSKLRYWIDFKNLSADNCEKAIPILDKLTKKYKIKKKVMVESEMLEPLQYARDNGFFIILWVDDLYWRKHEREDSIEVCNTIRNKINQLKPDAISGSYHMYPILCDTFPEQNIHYWDTPKKYSEENVNFTRHLCKNKSIKVVLVDYDEPIDY